MNLGRVLPRVIISLAISALIMAWALNRTAKKPVNVAPSTVLARAPYDPTILPRDIEFYEKKVRETPQGAIERTKLAGLYLQRCRESGDIADAMRAEKTARESLKILNHGNIAAELALAQSLVTQHRFGEAKKIVDRLASADAGDSQARRLQTEIAIELGDYDAAKAALAAPNDTEDAGLKTLRARLLDLDGQPEIALRLLRQAQAQIDKNIDVQNENAAWYHVRVGDQYYSLGRAAEAEASYKEALSLFPRDYKAMFGLARLNAGKKQWAEAERWGRKAAEIVPAPETMALVGDMATLQGNSAEGARQYSVVEATWKLSRAQGSTYDRQYALFCADHDRNLPAALQLARNEMKVRHDILAYDTLAWTAYKSGKLDEAATAIHSAISHGTKDSRILFHAARIERIRGNAAEADRLQKLSSASNPICWIGLDGVPPSIPTSH